MSDTKRNYTGLSAIFPDNTNQSITPQDLRDGFKSVTGSNILLKLSRLVVPYSIKFGNGWKSKLFLLIGLVSLVNIHL